MDQVSGHTTAGRASDRVFLDPSGWSKVPCMDVSLIKSFQGEDMDVEEVALLCQGGHSFEVRSQEL